MVYRFLMDSKVDTHNLLISDRRSSAKVVNNLVWTQDPSVMLTELVIRDLESSGLFQKAVDQTSNVPYRYALEGTIKKFEGTINDSKASGIIEAKIRLIDFETRPVGQSQLLKKDYLIETRSKDDSPKSLAEALDKAAKKLSQELRNDIGKAIEKNP